MSVFTQPNSTQICHDCLYGECIHTGTSVFSMEVQARVIKTPNAIILCQPSTGVPLYIVIEG